MDPDWYWDQDRHNRQLDLENSGHDDVRRCTCGSDDIVFEGYDRERDCDVDKCNTCGEIMT